MKQGYTYVETTTCFKQKKLRNLSIKISLHKLNLSEIYLNVNSIKYHELLLLLLKSLLYTNLGHEHLDRCIFHKVQQRTT